MEVFDGNSLRSGLDTLLTMPVPACLIYCSPPKGIRDYSGQVNGVTASDAQRWRADVGVTFPQPEDAEGSRNQTADEV